MFGAFSHSVSQIQLAIEISCLRPEIDGLLRSAKRLLEYRKRPKRVCEVERGCPTMTAIDSHSFLVTRLCQPGPPSILMDVAEMSNGVGQSQGAALASADPDCFLVKWESGIAATQVPFDLTEPFKRTNQGGGAS
jgi:hypothetical protein